VQAFIPAPVMKCVEVVKVPHTLEETAELTMELACRLGKEPVKLQEEVYGFLVNRILAAISLVMKLCFSWITLWPRRRTSTAPWSMSWGTARGLSG